MTVEELSKKIIDEGYLVCQEPKYVCTSEAYEISHSDNEFAHYGVLGMKWGVRKDRQRKGETDQQYKDRLDRQSRERQAEADRKAKSKDQKRQLKAQEKDKKRALRSQERLEKARLKSQLNTTKANLKAQEKQRKEVQKQYERQEEQKRKEAAKSKSKKSSKKQTTPVSMMTDEELRAAINRINMEKQYKDATKKKPGALSKAAKTLIVPVGLAVVKTRLTKMANTKLDNIEAKHAAKKAEKLFDKAKKEAANFNKAAAGVPDVSFDDISALSSVLGMSYQELTRGR